MYDILIEPFDGMDDWQPIFHAAFALHFDGHETVTESYLETLYTNQRAECSRFKNKTIMEAGVCKNDITELRDLGLL